MKATRFKVFTSSLFVLLASCAVVSAQTVAGGNGDFNTPASSSSIWGTTGGPGTYAAGPATVNWTTGGQYAYDPSDISGWSFSGGAGIQQNGSAWGFNPAPLGAAQSAFLQSYNGSLGVPTGNATNPSSISTTLSGLTPTDEYTLTFYMASRGGYGLNPIIVSNLGGQSYQETSPPSTGAWSAYSIVFTANSSSEVLTLISTFPASGSYDNDTGIADVSILPGTTVVGSQIFSTVPEGSAAGLYLLLAGAVCLGAMFLSSRNRFESSASA